MLEEEYFYFDANFLTPEHREEVDRAIWVWLSAIADPDYTPETIAREFNMAIAIVKRDLRKLAGLGYLEWNESFYVNAARNKIPNKLRWDIWVRDNYTCLHCGKRRDLSIDHIIPVKNGGRTVEENLQTLCKPCNSKKGTKENER